ncbi:Outer membrane protein F [Candidatus Providencia siddallii]|uniref:Outer membrane protein F n=1 Tax=Candidatus Providencia siddallii TaxID=1715285 RepID=A0A0M6W795_9GAMM|nr:Outer membrane protein F [Candidatus Providencia siddallii]
MKLNIFAVIFTYLLVVNIADAAEIYDKNGNKLDVYGKIGIRHRLSDVKDNFGDIVKDGDDSRIRLGIKGDTKITDNLIGFGRFEFETKINKTENNNINKNRLAYVGFKINDFGSIDYGRNYGIIYDTASWTDVLPLWGGDSIVQTDTYMTGRNRNLLTYRNNNAFGYIDGLSLAIQYQANNIEDINITDSYYRNNKNGYGISTAYNLGWGLTLGGAYFNSVRTEEQRTNVNAPGKNAQAWNVGGKFDANNLYLAAMYGETSNMTHFLKANYIANKTKNIELVAQYLLNFGLKPSIAFVKSKCKDLESYINNNSVKYISVGSYYDFSKNISAVFDYKINLLKNNEFSKEIDINTDNIIGLGLNYKF